MINNTDNSNTTDGTLERSRPLLRARLAGAKSKARPLERFSPIFAGFSFELSVSLSGFSLVFGGLSLSPWTFHPGFLFGCSTALFGFLSPQAPYMCVYIYIYICIIHTYTYTYVYLSLSLSLSISLSISLSLYIYINKHTYTHTHIYIYIYIYAARTVPCCTVRRYAVRCRAVPWTTGMQKTYMHVSMCIYIYI